MDERRHDLCKYRLEQANDSLRAAQNCLDDNLCKDALNRSYYAAFYAVKAVLALEEKDFKRHKDVVAYFNQRYVKDERIPRKIGRMLGKLKQYREESDYEDFYVASADEAKEQLAAAAEIIEAIKKFLNEGKTASGLDTFFGSMPDMEDGMGFQEKARAEWDEKTE